MNLSNVMLLVYYQVQQFKNKHPIFTQMVQTKHKIPINRKCLWPLVKYNSIDIVSNTEIPIVA